MFCKACGKEINDNAYVCVHCGVKVGEDSQNPIDSGSIGWGVLGFFIPLVGLILWLLWKPTQPKNAKMAGMGALIGFIVNIVITIIYVVLMFSIAASLY